LSLIRATTHRVDQDVGRLQVLRRLGVAGFPAVQSGQRILFLLRPSDLDQRKLGRPPLRRLHPGRLAGLLLIVWWPGCIAQTLPFVFLRELQQRIE
jgi:hypothetical protein